MKHDRTLTAAGEVAAAARTEAASTPEEASRKFHALVWPQLAAVLRVARLLTRDDDEADDLAQETVLKAYKAIDRFVEGTDVKAWLLTILRRTRIDRLRAPATAPTRTVSLDALEVEASVKPHGEGASGEVPWERPEEILNGFSDHQIIDALQELAEELRLTLLLVDVEGMEQKEAALVLGVPVGTVKSRVHRGRATLRAVLAPLARERGLTSE